MFFLTLAILFWQPGPKWFHQISERFWHLKSQHYFKKNFLHTCPRNIESSFDRVARKNCYSRKKILVIFLFGKKYVSPNCFSGHADCSFKFQPCFRLQLKKSENFCSKSKKTLKITNFSWTVFFKIFRWTLGKQTWPPYQDIAPRLLRGLAQGPQNYQQLWFPPDNFFKTFSSGEKWISFENPAEKVFTKKSHIILLSKIREHIKVEFFQKFCVNFFMWLWQLSLELTLRLLRVPCLAYATSSWESDESQIWKHSKSNLISSP